MLFVRCCDFPRVELLAFNAKHRLWSDQFKFSSRAAVAQMFHYVNKCHTDSGEYVQIPIYDYNCQVLRTTGRASLKIASRQKSPEVKAKVQIFTSDEMFLQPQLPRQERIRILYKLQTAIHGCKCSLKDTFTVWFFERDSAGCHKQVPHFELADEFPIANFPKLLVTTWADDLGRKLRPEKVRLFLKR